jgi:hypothetical protein
MLTTEGTELTEEKSIIDNQKKMPFFNYRFESQFVVFGFHPSL